MFFETIYGNTMATKNLIVLTLWIIQVYEIPRAKPPIQNCLGYLFRERVGIILLFPNKSNYSEKNKFDYPLDQ